jgi:hypothetical protein
MTMSSRLRRIYRMYCLGARLTVQPPEQSIREPTKIARPDSGTCNRLATSRSVWAKVHPSIRTHLA